MLCCSIGAFILSQLYAGAVALRALLFGAPDDLRVPVSRRGAGAIMASALDFSRTRMAVALMIGMAGLAVAFAVRDTAMAHGQGWVPVATAFCGKALS